MWPFSKKEKKETRQMFSDRKDKEDKPKKDKITGNYVKFSVETAKVNPDMILDAYKKLIDEITNKILNLSDVKKFKMCISSENFDEIKQLMENPNEDDNQDINENDGFIKCYIDVSKFIYSKKANHNGYGGMYFTNITADRIKQLIDDETTYKAIEINKLIVKLKNVEKEKEWFYNTYKRW